MQPIEDLWTRLEAWYGGHGVTLRLRPPATEAQLAEAERAMGLALPEDFRASLRVHDGQEAAADVVPWCPATGPLASLERIVGQHRELQALAAPVPDPPPLDLLDHFVNVLYHPARIPVAGTPWFDGDNTYLDLAPGPAGTSGQLVTTTSECDFALLDLGFGRFLERYVGMLERGELVWRDGAVAPRDGAFRGHPADALARVSYLGLREG